MVTISSPGQNLRGHVDLYPVRYFLEVGGQVVAIQKLTAIDVAAEKAKPMTAYLKRSIDVGVGYVRFWHVALVGLPLQDSPFRVAIDIVHRDTRGAIGSDDIQDFTNGPPIDEVIV